MDDVWRLRLVKVEIRDYVSCLDGGDIEDLNCQPNAETQRRRDAETQRHRDTETQRHRDTETQRHRDTETQRHRDTETQRHRDTETQRHRDTETQRHRRAHTQSHSHALLRILWPSGRSCWIATALPSLCHALRSLFSQEHGSAKVRFSRVCLLRNLLPTSVSRIQWGQHTLWGKPGSSSYPQKVCVCVCQLVFFRARLSMVSSPLPWPLPSCAVNPEPLCPAFLSLLFCQDAGPAVHRDPARHLRARQQLRRGAAGGADAAPGESSRGWKSMPWANFGSDPSVQVVRGWIGGLNWWFGLVV